MGFQSLFKINYILRIEIGSLFHSLCAQIGAP